MPRQDAHYDDAPTVEKIVARLENPGILFSGGPQGAPGEPIGCAVAFTEPERRFLLDLLKNQ
jgi:hypothetical protein